MIVSIAASLVAAGAVSVQAQPTVHALPEVFVAACLDGAARLSAGQAVAVSFEDLPSSVREQLGVPASGQIWRLNGPGRAFLYILNYEPRPAVNPKICGLAADSMELNAAVDAMDMRIAGSTRSHKLRGTEWLVPQDGYTALATTADEFNVLQVSWLSDEQRAEALESIHGLPQ